MVSEKMQHLATFIKYLVSLSAIMKVRILIWICYIYAQSYSHIWLANSLWDEHVKF